MVGGSRCNACSKEYSNPTSLQHHLNYSKECYNKLIVAGKTYIEYLPGKNNTSEIPRNKYGVPPLPSEGPQEECLDRAEGEPPEAQEWGLMKNLVEMLINLDADTTLLQCIDNFKGELSQSYNSLRDIRGVLRYCLEEFKVGESSNPG